MRSCTAFKISVFLASVSYPDTIFLVGMLRDVILLCHSYVSVDSLVHIVRPKIWNWASGGEVAFLCGRPENSNV
jgi:hypothetical protein